MSNPEHPSHKNTGPGDAPVRRTGPQSEAVDWQHGNSGHLFSCASRLLSGRGYCKRIVCPYHSWTYRLDGRLIGVPDMGEATDFEPDDYPLLELPVASWAGIVFVRYGADPPPPFVLIYT